MSFNINSLDPLDPYQRKFTPFFPSLGTTQQDRQDRVDAALGVDFCERPMFRKSIPVPSIPAPAFAQPVPPWVDPRKANPSPKINWSTFNHSTHGPSKND